MTSDYVPSAQRRKIGHITPSSNTVLEPLTALMTREIDSLVSHHFTRIKVEAITLEQRHIDQFRPEAMLAAAELLSDAAVDAIVWNGTAAAWTGFDDDRALCALISEHTGIASSTSSLAQLEILELAGLSNIGLAVPYTEDVTERIVEVYANEGIQVIARAHGGVSSNRDMAHVAEERVRTLLRAADSPGAECLVLICTGMAAAQLVAEMEVELGKPIFDSVAVVLWKALALAGLEPRLEGWGSLFAGTPSVLAA